MKRIRQLFKYLFTGIFFLGFYGCGAQSDKEKSIAKEEWISIFNGKNLDGWDIKIKGFELNENYNNTFSAAEGILRVSYDDYKEFNNEFGHIYYNQSFSKYKLRLDYRFVDDQVTNGEGWAFRNNGIMFHSQAASDIEIDQDFPVSFEAQMLGDDGSGERPTGNLCTPGTYVHINGERRDEHCIPSNGPTIGKDEWVKMELVVYADSLVHHLINGDTVMTYHDLRLESNDQPIGSGYIALQAESHPTEFRNIEVLILEE